MLLLKIKSLILIRIIFLTILFSLLTLAQTEDDTTSTKDFEFRVILIGDAGHPSEEFREPVLVALERDASVNPDSTAVVFLGDNIYPRGLAEDYDPFRKEYERRIDEQFLAVSNAGADAFFIPGNHDWAHGSYIGWERIIRQSNQIVNKAVENIQFVPLLGCPGPEYVDYGNDVRIIFIDSQWWLQESNKPLPSDSICLYATEEGILNALDTLLSSSDKKLNIVTAHHPLKTYGPHGGYYDWKDHIFPLRNIEEYLWIPLPIIGSLYPIARGMGVTPQDLTNDTYKHYIASIESVLQKYNNVLFAAGHEHSLQILEGINNNLYLVSGSGIWDHYNEYLGDGDDLIYKGKYSGYMVVDFYLDGKIELSVIKVIDTYGTTITTYTRELDPSNLTLTQN